MKYVLAFLAAWWTLGSAAFADGAQAAEGVSAPTNGYGHHGKAPPAPTPEPEPPSAQVGEAVSAPTTAGWTPALRPEAHFTWCEAMAWLGAPCPEPEVYTPPPPVMLKPPRDDAMLVEALTAENGRLRDKVERMEEFIREELRK